MTFQSSLSNLTNHERENYGLARVRDAAFDAVHTLWRRRQKEGLKQKDIAIRLGREKPADQAWVSRNLRGPGNWTMRTLGAFVEALDGEIEIRIFAKEDPFPVQKNSDAYSGYMPEPVMTDPMAERQAAIVRANNPSKDRLSVSMLMDSQA